MSGVLPLIVGSAEGACVVIARDVYAAFQPDAFQNDAFQVAETPAVQATLPSLVGSGEGEFVYPHGDAVGTLPAITGDGDGEVQIIGSGSGVLSLVGDAEGAYVVQTIDFQTESAFDPNSFQNDAFQTDFVPGAAGTLPPLFAFAVDFVSGTATNTLPSITGTADGAYVVQTVDQFESAFDPNSFQNDAFQIDESVGAAGTLPAIIGLASAFPIGTADGTLSAITGDANGIAYATGLGAGTLPKITGSGAGTVETDFVVPGGGSHDFFYKPPRRQILPENVFGKGQGALPSLFGSAAGLVGPREEFLPTVATPAFVAVKPDPVRGYGQGTANQFTASANGSAKLPTVAGQGDGNVLKFTGDGKAKHDHFSDEQLEELLPILMDWAA